jgi:integrase
MGSHLMRRPPKFVQGFIDRHGKPRFYFRRAGFKSVALPGLPWSPEFMAAYELALARHPITIGTSRVLPGSIRALAVSYFGSNAFRSMSAITQTDYRHAIDGFCRHTDKRGQQFGDKRVATLQSEHVIRMMAERKPNSANRLRKVLRALMKHAVEIGLRADDPTKEVRAVRVKSDGFHSWTDAELAQYEGRHAIGSLGRLAFALLLYTGQRRSDVVHMGRQHVRDGMLYIRQAKTGVELAIPIHKDLEAMLAGATDRLTFLVNELGRPFTVGSFSNWFRVQCNMANLPHCSAHGLRKAAARRLAEAGCTAHEIAAITGHASLKEIVRYTKAVDQKRLAKAAIEKITGTSTVKPLARFDRNRK